MATKSKRAHETAEANTAEVEAQEKEDTKQYTCLDGTTIKGEVVEPGQVLDLTPTDAKKFTDSDVRLTEVTE